MAGEQCTLSNDGLQHITLNDQGMRTSSSGPAQATLDVLEGQVGVGSAIVSDGLRFHLYRSIRPEQHQGGGAFLDEDQMRKLEEIYDYADLSNTALAEVALAAATVNAIGEKPTQPHVDIALGRATRVACECPQEYLGLLAAMPDMRGMLSSLKQRCPPSANKPMS